MNKKLREEVIKKLKSGSTIWEDEHNQSWKVVLLDEAIEVLLSMAEEKDKTLFEVEKIIENFHECGRFTKDEYWELYGKLQELKEAGT